MISLTTPQPPLLDRLTGWLEHPIGKFVTGGIFPACIALLTSVGYQGYTRYDDNKIKVKDAFVNEALSYESVSLAVLEPLLTQSGKIERKDRQALIDNLIQQSQTLYAASNLLKESKIPIAERYQQELLAVRDLVNKLEPSRVTEFFAAPRTPPRSCP